MYYTEKMSYSFFSKLSTQKLHKGSVSDKVEILYSDCSYIACEKEYVLISNFGAIIWGHLIG